jgi:predicted house-cleaning noncanonical NTP pyrophosphatase (MazG superfamily)
MASKFIISSSEKADVNSIGLKATNLYEFKLVSPEFITLSSDFYNGWKKSGAKFLEANNKTLTDLSKLLQKRHLSKVILRSSCTHENLSDRGKFLTEISGTSVSSIKKSLLLIYNDFEKSNHDQSRSIAIIVQDYKKPKVQGHLSNERRVDENRNVWIIEREFANEEETKVDRIEVPEDSPKELDHAINKCLNANTLTKNLGIVAKFFTAKNKRVHIEWLWDGSNFWIVQVDYEPAIPKGVKPANDWYSEQRKSKHKNRNSRNDFEVFETVESSRSDWYKIKCVKKFAECKFPYWQIYVLENPTILQRLSEGDVDLSLASDLKKLLVTPIIVRSDVKKNDGSRDKLNVLLPRTETMYDYKSVLDFLSKQSSYFIKKGLAPNQYCFLLHQFIPSNAGAFSYASPGIDRVRIDSTWGIVEGLYFHPHDSFEVKLSEKKPSRKIRCKSQYIDFDSKGNWHSKEAGTAYDWRPSLTDHQLKTIAKYSQELADAVGKTINIMFFINDKKLYPEILPWIYQEDELPAKGTDYTNVIFSDKRIVITSKEDIVKLKHEPPSSSKIKLLIKLKPDLYRDKKFIEEIAAFTKKKNYVVDIEGSILSHPYYVLHSMGVHVRCVDPFEATYTAQEFHKLVRDKIPVLIESHAEQALVTKVSSNELMMLLKEKAIEEALELYWSRNNDAVVEEMADLLEVIMGACKAFGLEFEDIKNIAKKKREKRGGFENGVILVATKENSLFQLVNKKSRLFAEKDEIDDVKLRPTIKFFQKGDVKDFKSLTEVSEIRLSYINNYASKGNKFKYLLKNGEYNTISVEYREKDIIIKLENLDLELNPSQLKLL